MAAIMTQAGSVAERMPGPALGAALMEEPVAAADLMADSVAVATRAAGQLVVMAVAADRQVMNPEIIETPNLQLRLQTAADVRALIEKLSPAERAEVSPEWLARALSEPPNPWAHGFSVILKADGATVGNAGFKGPPNSAGTVEIAYGINPEHQRKGYATEAARALSAYAFQDQRVHIVCAHTLPEPNASTRVLTKCGFHHVGEVMDPEDGRVWRWEKTS